MSRNTQLPDKLFFKIGEVADIVGVKPHVLRYWESEFGALRPMKTRGAHRVYKRRDVELAMFIRRLLHDEGYTIPGAKKRLRDEGRDRVSSEPDPTAAREVALRAELIGIRDYLRGVLETLHDQDIEQEVQAANAEPDTVTIQAVVPAPVYARPPQ